MCKCVFGDPPFGKITCEECQNVPLDPVGCIVFILILGFIVYLIYLVN